jgi:membrane-associated phospholipid phosphatase
MGRRVFVRHAIRGRKPRFLLSGVAVSLVGYIALAIFAAQQQLFALDYGTRVWVRILQYEMLNAPMAIVTQLGDSIGLISLIALGMLILWRVRRRWAVALPVLMAGAGALQWVAKAVADRDRPNDAPWGFPSGHALSMVVFFGLMIYLVATASRQRRRWRLLACLVCLAPVVVVSYSRLYLDKHWLSDLVGGLTAGMAYLMLVIWVVEVLLVRPKDEPALGGPDNERNHEYIIEERVVDEPDGSRGSSSRGPDR